MHETNNGTMIDYTSYHSSLLFFKFVNLPEKMTVGIPPNVNDESTCLAVFNFSFKRFIIRQPIIETSSTISVLTFDHLSSSALELL